MLFYPAVPLHRPSRRVFACFCLFTILCADAAFAQARPSSSPATSLDDSTNAVLNELNANSVATNSVSVPLEAAKQRAEAEPDDPANPSTWAGWARLIRLFAPSLITATAVAIACGVAGVFVLLRREALLAMALPQVVAVWAAIGMRLGWPTLPPALLGAAITVGYLSLTRRSGRIIGLLPAVYVAGLSLSFLIIANHGQDVADLQNLFTGIDVAVSPARAAVATPILLAVAVIVAALWRRWLLLAQAPAAAELAGVHPGAADALFLSLLATVVLLGTDSLGVVMVLAMLFLPAATAMPWTSRIPATLLSSALLAVAFLAIGFWASNQQSWPLSQSVGGVGFGCLLISHSLAKAVH